MQRDRRQLLQLRYLVGKLVAIGTSFGQHVADFDKVLCAICDGLYQPLDLGNRIAVALS